MMAATRVSRSPHARGDGPWKNVVVTAEELKSPRAWGWTVVERKLAAPILEVPTRVGMDRSDS